jgi:flagellar biosynthesis/type III secretory pathway protein FliH
MDEKQPTFTVTDRRKFTLEGERRDDAPAAEPEAAVETPTAAAPVSEKVVTMPSPETREPAAAQEAEPEEPELQQFTAQETAEQDAAYQESSRQIDDMLRQANPGMGATGVITFEHVIQSFYVSAMLAMGAGTEPGQKARVDILGARQSIDMLALLQEKTKGNLTPKEESTLQNVLFELRMMFLEITNAIAQSALRPADGKKK